MRSALNGWLGANSIFVGCNEELRLAISADVHFIILAKVQMLGPVRLLSLLVSGPCSLSEYSLRVCLGNLGWVQEWESSAVEYKYSFDALLLANVLDVSKGFSVKVQIVLRIILFLKVLNNLTQVCKQVTGICLNDVLHQEFYKLLLRWRNIW